MSSSTTLVSLDEYLATTYRPDRDYVDSEVVERNVGEWDHSRLQALLLKQLPPYEDTLAILAARSGQDFALSLAGLVRCARETG